MCIHTTFQATTQNADAEVVSVSVPEKSPDDLDLDLESGYSEDTPEHSGTDIHPTANKNLGFLDDDSDDVTITPPSPVDFLESDRL